MQWRIGPFRLDLDHACLWRGDERVGLRPKVFDLLVYLVEHAGELVSKEELLGAIWPETVVADSALTVSVSELRKALGETARAPQFVATVHRRGYRFIAPAAPLESLTSPAPSTPLASPRVEMPEVTPPMAAERRQLTVLFCDLMDASRLAGQLDPEDLGEVLHAYHQTCADVVARFDGYVAQYLGDGVLAYFGYPVAHEDDAQRAVWSGLGLLVALAALNARLALPTGYELTVRLGLHTGLVVVGNVGTGERQEPLAQGETLHIASRLQHLAGPNELVISGATRDLLGEMFRLKDLGEQMLRGVRAPMQIYRVQGAQTVESRFEAMTATELTPLVGREEELELLWRRWQQAAEGEGQVVLLSGEAGLGKSRLTQALCERLGDDNHFRVLYQCSPYHTNSAFYPIIVHLERTLQLDQVPSPAAKLDRLETLLAQAGLPVAEVAPLFAALLSIPSGDRYAPLRLSPERQKERTIEALVAQLLSLSQREPLLLLFEDAHWSDPSTLEVLDRLVDSLQEASVLAVITYRPVFEPHWRSYGHVTAHMLNRLTRRQVMALVAGVTGRKSLPQDVLDQIVAKTDGVPLFVEELTKTVLASELLDEQGDHYALRGPLPPLAIPATLQDSLMARLDGLESAKAVAQYAAVMGRQVSYALLEAVLPLDEATLQHELSRLVEAELLYQRGLPPQATYTFKHGLIQDSAYESLLRSTKQAYHHRIAEVLEARFPETVATQPELLAFHYTEAGRLEQAIGYWQRAGQSALQRSAYVEAIAHLTQVSTLLHRLPESPERDKQELEAYLTLGLAYTATKGFASPEAGRAHTRVLALARQVEENPQLAPVQLGLWVFYHVRAELHTARERGEELLRLAQRLDDPLLLMQAHHALGITLVDMGRFTEAYHHLEQGRALYAPAHHQAHIQLSVYDPIMACCGFAAHALWLLGYPEQAIQRTEESLTRSYALDHPYTLAGALSLAAMHAQWRREPSVAQEQTHTLIPLCQEQGFPYFLAWGTMIRGWALSAQGQRSEGIAQLREGLAAYRATGAAVLSTYWYAILAETLGEANQIHEGLDVLDEALGMVRAYEERRWEADLYRLKGVFLLAQAEVASSEAEACLQQALTIARRQYAKSLELRAAMSLARLWQQQGKHREARDLLAPVYAWFTEGFETADLREAKALLDA
jgi:predicted ATPase/class 3 adenylate cyclase